jgi:glycosyltransferase involved in cell wall biosynthesis
MTTVDVVIPVRDGARFLPACLDSVLAQTFPPRRILVVDDGSTDDTPAVVRGYASRAPEIQPIRTAPTGVSHARNVGIRASAADCIAFIDSDDVWTPDKLARQMAILDGSPDVGFVNCGYFIIDADGTPREAAGHAPSRRGDVFRDLIDGYQVAGSASAVVARRALLLDVGGFDETLAHSEDLDVWLKLARISRLDYVADPLAGIREHAGSVQRRPSRSRDEEDFLSRLRVFEKWVDTAPPAAPVLSGFAMEAAHLALMRMAGRLRFDFHRIMRGQAPKMTRAMFGDARGYRSRVLSAILPELRHLIAQKLIVRSPTLLRWCQAFGRLKEVEVDRRQAG